MKKRVENINEEINPYEIDKLSKIPSWLIILFLKYWAAAAAVFFGTIGIIDLGIDFSQMDISNPISVINNSEMIIILLGVFLGVLGNYAVKQVVLLLHNRRNNTYKYNLINKKGLMALFIYLGYSLVISFILFFITIFLSSKGLVLSVLDNSGSGIEPFTYAFCYVIIDGICVLIKNLVVMIYQRVTYYKQLRRA